MSPCIPSQPRVECFRCIRHQPAFDRLHTTKGFRNVVVIDASVVCKPGDKCPMLETRQ